MTSRRTELRVRGIEDLRSSAGTRSMCGSREVEGVSEDTNELPTDYAYPNMSVKLNHRDASMQTDRPSRKGQWRALREGVVKVRRPRGTRGRSGAENLDDAETSAMLEDVMAGGDTSGQGGDRRTCHHCREDGANARTIGGSRRAITD